MKKKNVIILIALVILITLLLLVLIINQINKKNDNYSIEFPEGKTLKTLYVNDDIKIGTEKFKVFKINENDVYAMPYYNITLSNTDPEQTTSPIKHYIQFVDSYNNYWKEKTDIIDMSENKNNIQTYITAYSKKLNSLDSRVTARIARHSEMEESEMTNDLRNPGKNQIFWLGSSSDSTHVYYIEKNGRISDDNYEGSIGVRPIIIIKK